MSKIPVILLPGWGMPTTVWEGVRYCLQPDRVTTVLPLPQAPFLSLQDAINQLIKQLPMEPCVLVGWSLGGALASLIAYQAQERVQGVITVGTNVRFVANHIWPYAMPEVTFYDFINTMQKQPERTWLRFQQLCVTGAKKPKTLLQKLQEIAPYRGDYHYLCGLHWLANIDLTEIWAQLESSWHIFSHHDAVIPVAPNLNAYPVARHRIHIAPSGHILPIAKPYWVADCIRQYQQDVNYHNGV